MSSLFRTKSIDEVIVATRKTELKRDFRAIDLVLLGLGGIIGSGIFVLTGIAAAQYSGPSICVSFLVGAIACVFTALAYAELSVMLPVAGGPYSYAFVTFGEGIAFLVGWFSLMVFVFGSSTVAAGWSSYMVGLLNGAGLQLPSSLVHIPAQGGAVNLPAVTIIGILTFFLTRGTTGAAKLNGLLVVVKLVAIFFFLASAIPFVQVENWQDFAPQGFFGMMAGAGFVFIAYTGFDTVANAAEECRNPNRDLPIGIIGSLLGSAFLYVVVAATLTGITHYSRLNDPEAMAYALRSHGIHFGSTVVATGALAGMTTVILSQMYGMSRLLMVLARDGLVPRFFSKVDKKHSSPYMGLFFAGIIDSCIAGFVPVSTLGQLASMSTLILFAVVSLCVIVMRMKYPDRPRPFRCPAVYFVASASAILCLFLFFQLLVRNWQPYLLASFLGLVFYLVLLMFRSKQVPASPA